MGQSIKSNSLNYVKFFKNEISSIVFIKFPPSAKDITVLKFNNGFKAAPVN